MSTPADQRADQGGRDPVEGRPLRHARAKRWALRSALALGVLLVLVAALLYWLLATVGGRDLLLSQVVSRLPANATFTWQQAEGPVSGPITLRGVVFTLDELEFTAQRVTLDPAIWPLLGKTLRLDALQVEGATLYLPASEEPFKLPTWPELLPKLPLPLAVHAGDVRVDDFKVFAETDVPGQRELLIGIDRLRGGLKAQPGELHVEHLVVDSSRGRFTVHGDYAPGDNYRIDLVATAVLPAAADRTPARLGLVARGDLDAMTVGIGGRAPGPLRVTLQLDGTDADNPQWRLRAEAAALDIGLLTATAATAASTPPSEAPLSLQLAADDVGSRIDLRGRISQGDFSARIAPSQLRIEDQVLELQPLVLRLLDGTVVVRGRADFNDPENAGFRFAVKADDLSWGGTSASTAAPATPTPVITADAALGIAGTMQRWAAIGHATLARDGEQARVEFDTRGSADGLTIKTLHAQMPTGALDASGTLAWAPALSWEIEASLAGFDPGYFAAGWDGAVDGELHSLGKTRDDGGLEIAVKVEDLGGRLRGEPLDGHGRFVLHGAAAAGRARYAGELALSLGGSRIQAQGQIGDTLDIDATFSPLQLADLLPDAAGTLRGDVHLTGALSAPDVAADLEGSGLKYAAYSADSLSIHGRLPWSQGDGALTVRASGLQAGVALDTLSIDARGAVESLQLDLQTSGEVGALSLSGHVDKRGNTWAGALATLLLAPAKGAQWRLQQPAQFSWTPSPDAGGDITLSPACFASSAGGSLCLRADWPQQGIAIDGDGLPLSLVSAYLPERGDDGQWQLRGQIAIEAQLQPDGSGWRGFANITSAGGGLKFNQSAQQELIRYEDFSLRTTFRPAGIEADLAATLNDDGRLRASLVTGWEPTSPLSGQIALDIDELTWIELFSPDIVKPEGRLSADITLGGTRATPRIGGSAQLSDFSTEIPSLAITLREGNVRLLAQPDGSARISGSVRSAPSDETGKIGVLNIDGSLSWQGEAPLLLNISGERVLVSDTPELHAVISPDVDVRVKADEPTRVTGTVVINEAAIDLERLETGVSTSPDVVVLDPIDPDDGGMATGLVLDLTLVLGDDVLLDGFGLEASLDGRLQVHARPGREVTANGRLTVDGQYEAYGQELAITHGELIWTRGPIADPILDIRAERQIDDVTAGVNISGRVSRPQIEVWTDPASSQSQALAYLTLGRPLSSLSGAERGQLDAASAALTAGGSLLAGKLGAKLGLDEAGVMDSRALGGSVLGVGKQISPRLYVGYGVSLLGTGQVLILKYLLDHGFDIEIESSTVENRALLNWRIER